MQKLLLLLALTIAVYCVCETRANRLDDIEAALESEENDAFFDSADADEEFERRSSDKSYLTAPKHSERLRQCVKCVGNERSNGKNVKQATDRCNKICKRGLFDTRA